jgi:hypothetical protein
LHLEAAIIDDFGALFLGQAALQHASGFRSALLPGDVPLDFAGPLIQQQIELAPFWTVNGGKLKTSIMGGVVCSIDVAVCPQIQRFQSPGKFNVMRAAIGDGGV